MLNRSASLAMSKCVLKALPGKLDIKRHSPSILYVGIHYLRFLSHKMAMQTSLNVDFRIIIGLLREKTCLLGLQTTKAQTSLRICPV